MADARTIQTRFVILAAPRSGSNMLCTMLDSHPAILCHHEIFNPKGVRLALRLRESDFSLGTVAEREADPRQFLERVWETRLGHACVGFKLTHRQNELIFGHLLADPTVAKVVLRRQNRLKTYVSHQISETLAEWEVYRPQDLATDRPMVEVDPERFLERVAFDDAYYNEIRQAVEAGGHAWIEVWYESLFSVDRQNAILEFLGLGPSAGGLEMRSVKQNSSDLRDLVKNYDELLHFFQGTQFEADLRDSGR
jgi:LPS sulfotransferase NodH